MQSWICANQLHGVGSDPDRHRAHGLLKVDIIKEGQFQEPDVSLGLFVVEQSYSVI